MVEINDDDEINKTINIPISHGHAIEKYNYQQIMNRNNPLICNKGSPSVRD